MELLTSFFLVMTVCVVGLALAVTVPVAGALLALALAYALLQRLFWIAAIPYFLWWLLVHGRKKSPRWETLGRFRYAHRGLHGPGVPENSLAAFRHAAEAGFGAELDVHLTKDGRLAVIHDSALARTCGAPGRVEECTASELAQLRLEGTGERIPLLEEVLPLFEGRAPLIVELKPEGGNWGALAEAAAACLDQFDLDFCMESFDPRALVWLRRNRPEILRGQLGQSFLKDPAGLALPTRLALTGLLGNVLTRPDFIAWKFEDRRNPSRTLCCRRWGAQAAYWTLRAPETLAAAEREGALVIFEGFTPDSEVVV